MACPLGWAGPLSPAPFAIERPNRAWVAEHHDNALLHRVDPRHGLTDADYLELDGWLRGTQMS